MTDNKSYFDPNEEPNAASRRANAPTTPRTTDITTPASSCDRIRPELKAYLDGQTGWWRQRSIRAHVTQCPACREEMEAMRDFSDKLRGANTDTLDPILRAKILAAVPHTPSLPLAEAHSSGRNWRNYRRPLFLVGAAASATLVGAVLYPALNSRSSSDLAAAPAATSETQMQTTMTTKQTPSASAPPGVAPLYADGSIASNGLTNKSAAKSFQMVAPMARQPRNETTARPPALAAPPGEAKYSEAKSPESASSEANAFADKSAAAEGASTRAFRVVPESLLGSMSDKSPAQSVQNFAIHATPPVVAADTAVSDITVQVRDVEARSADVEQKALAAGGKIVVSALSTGEDKTPSARLTLKIPAARLAGFLTQVAHLGQMQSRQNMPEEEDRQGKERAKAKERVPFGRQETLVPVTVNLKSSG